MSTLYIRNVPADVAELLSRAAEREGMSVNRLLVRELSAFARRTRNAEILAHGPDLDIDAESVVADIHAGRAER